MLGATTRLPAGRQRSTKSSTITTSSSCGGSGGGGGSSSCSGTCSCNGSSSAGGVEQPEADTPQAGRAADSIQLAEESNSGGEYSDEDGDDLDDVSVTKLKTA